MESNWPRYSDEEIAAVSAILRSGKVNYWSGEEGRDFEREFAEFCNVKYGVAVANGSVAIELMFRASGIGVGDEVIVTSRTFVASASSVVMCGATPVFADVDLTSQNITAETVQPLISKKTRAILAVHLAGWPCEMDELRDLADRNRLLLFEDCAQAHGATYNGMPVGSFGHAASFSFCTDKIISTGGEGGMLVSNDQDIWRRAWSIKDHGKDWSAVYEDQHPPGFRWLHRSIGTNWRLTEMQSAIGRIQLKMVANWVRVRRKNADLLLDAFGSIDGLRVPVPPIHIEHAYYRFYCFVRPERLRGNWSRDRIIATLNNLGVTCFHGSCPEVYLEGAFDGLEGSRRSRLPNAQELGETSLMFLVDHTVSPSYIDRTCQAVADVISESSK